MRRRSTSKQRGAEMSSRLMPPNAGAMRMTVSTISSTSWVSRQIGTALTLPKLLNRAHLPSMTGIAASGPMLPRPSTALPSLTTAIVLAFWVYSYTAAGSCAIALQGSATPGVYASARSSRVEMSILGTVSSLPFHSRCSSRAFCFKSMMTLSIKMARPAVMFRRAPLYTFDRRSVPQGGPFTIQAESAPEHRCDGRHQAGSEYSFPAWTAALMERSTQIQIFRAENDR